LLPSLRDRVADIPALARFFLSKFSIKSSKHIRSISSEYLEALQKHNWKGNIRELRNIIERSVILTDGSELLLESLPLDFIVNSASAKDYDLCEFSMANIEKQHIQKILKFTKVNKAEAARLMEIGIATLYRKIEEYQV